MGLGHLPNGTDYSGCDKLERSDAGYQALIGDPSSVCVSNRIAGGVIYHAGFAENLRRVDSPPAVAGVPCSVDRCEGLAGLCFGPPACTRWRAPLSAIQAAPARVSGGAFGLARSARLDRRARPASGARTSAFARAARALAEFQLAEGGRFFLGAFLRERDEFVVRTFGRLRHLLRQVPVAREGFAESAFAEMACAVAALLAVDAEGREGDDLQAFERDLLAALGTEPVAPAFEQVETEV